MKSKIQSACKLFCSPRTLGLGLALTAALLTNAQAQSPTVPDANVGLERSGPISPSNGYPEWYQDQTGLALELLTPKSTNELAAGYNVIVPADTVYPEVMPSAWAVEHFYWYAGSEILVGNSRARLIMAHEASFGAGSVKVGDQVTFTRIRVDFRSVPSTGTYIIETPYSTRTFTNVPAGSRIFDTEDVGIAPGPSGFELSLKTKVGPYLVASATPGGAELAPVTFQGRKYLADPAALVKLTGSPLGANRNAFRIWFKATALSIPVLLGQNTDFSLFGRVLTSNVPGRTSITRATKTGRTSPIDRRIDICAVAKSTLASRLPGAAYSTSAVPSLTAYLAPAVNTNGVLSIPTGTGYSMARMGSEFSYQSDQFSGRTALDRVTGITVVDNTGGVYTANVADAIALSAISYNPATTTLTLTAVSTDSLATLTVNTIDGPLTSTKAGNVYTVTGVTAAPCDVIVTSSAGGIASAEVLVNKK